MSRLALTLSFVAGVAVGSLFMWLLGDAEAPSRLAESRPIERAGSETRSEAGSVVPETAASVSRSTELAGMCPELSAELAKERLEVAGMKQTLQKRLDALWQAQLDYPGSSGSSGSGGSGDSGGTGGTGGTDKRDMAELEVCRRALESIQPVVQQKRLDPGRPADDSFDVDQLVERGYPPDSVERMQELWKDAKLAKLELHDKLARGEEPREYESYAEIERQLRQDLGDEDYGAMLYSTNQQNGVRLQRVLENSATYQAGLRKGVVIHSYDGIRVFKPMELQALIRDTPPGRVVAIEIVAKDGFERYFVDSGVVGASFGSVRVPPIRY